MQAKEWNTFLHSLRRQLKIRNLLARNAVSEALSTFAEVQRQEQQLFMEMEDRCAQKELEMEEKRMKLEQESDQCRESFMMEMMKMFAKSKHT